ncbi:MAG: DUF4294 domain-containing protein [Bacteroidaceae bacterium]|nr:DUF4294 domain-containing protein [Bacteroidaceae bacterium]
MKKFAFILFLALFSMSAFAQLASSNPIKIKIKKVSTTAEETPAKSNVIDFSADQSKVNVVYGRIEENGDTTLIVKLPEVDINLMNHYYEITETASGRRLVRNVRKAYPYAKLAKEKLLGYDTLLLAARNDRERRQLMKQAEKEITDQYTDELKDLTISQGAILIRLIDRETGDTSYKVVQELRGKVRALFYQGFARLWGYNLKTEYDPKHNEEDDKIETIVTLLERGVI